MSADRSLPPVRSAVAEDAPRIFAIIDACAAQGSVLPRAAEDVHAAVHSFVVAHDPADPAALLGCAALVSCGPDMGEIRSVAVAPEGRGRGVGRAVVDYLVAEALAINLEHLFLLTRIPEFFSKLGFHAVDPNDLPDSFVADVVHTQRRSLFNKFVMTMNLDLLAPAPPPPAAATEPVEPAQKNGAGASAGDRAADRRPPRVRPPQPATR